MTPRGARAPARSRRAALARGPRGELTGQPFEKTFEKRGAFPRPRPAHRPAAGHLPRPAHRSHVFRVVSGLGYKKEKEKRGESISILFYLRRVKKVWGLLSRFCGHNMFVSDRNGSVHKYLLSLSPSSSVPISQHLASISRRHRATRSERPRASAASARGSTSVIVRTTAWLPSTAPAFLSSSALDRARCCSRRRRGARRRAVRRRGVVGRPVQGRSERVRPGGGAATHHAAHAAVRGKRPSLQCATTL